MLCVMRSMLMPYFSRSPRSRFKICAWTETSSAEVGSSRISNFGLVEMARAMATRCRWPPDSSWGYRSSKDSGRPTSRRSSRPRISASARVQNRVESIGSPMIVESFILGLREEYGSWNTMFTSRRSARSSDDDRRRIEKRSAMASRRSEVPEDRAFSYSARSASGMSRRTSPSVGFRSRMRQRPTVLLPDPLSPTRPTTCSVWIFRSTSSTALREVVARNAPRTGKNLLRPYAAIIMLLPLEEPARDELVGPLPEVEWHDAVALFEGEGTPGMKGASGRWVAHVRDLAFDPFDGRSLQRRNRGDEHLRVWMQGLVEDIGRRSDLDDAPRVHDRDPVRDLRQDGQVMGNHDERRAHRSANLLDELEDLRLDRHVHGAGRLVHDDDFRAVRQGNRDHDPLAHPSRKFMREHFHDPLRVVDAQGGKELPRLAGSFSHEDATDELRKDGDAGELGGNRPGLRHALNNVPFPRLHRLPGQRANRLLLPRNVDILTPPDEQDLLLESNDIMVRRESPQGRLVALRRSQESQDLPHDLGGRFRSREYAPRQQRRVVHIDRFSDLESYG